MALTFALKNRLLQALGDNVTAYELAVAFVDSEEKLTVFERQFAAAYEIADMCARVSTAVSVAESIWNTVFAEPVTEAATETVSA